LNKQVFGLHSTNKMQGGVIHSKWYILNEGLRV